MAYFDVSKFNFEQTNTREYDRQIQRLNKLGQDTDCIDEVVKGAVATISSGGQKSFVIYGEPQSGKTEMMICLTAMLLDEGHRFIVHLLNDSVDLLGQNLTRFSSSGLSPSAQNYMEILDPAINIKAGKFVIFCKKNASNLTRLIDKIGQISQIVVIDDEADFATPNAKVNKNEKTKINELIAKIIATTGHYIGVTATPARLDVNNTFENDSKAWIKFRTHSKYTGQDHFFPMDYAADSKLRLGYKLQLMDQRNDDSKLERLALFRFLVNVSHLNSQVNDEKNYSFLIHTSGKKIDHKKDLGLFRSLLDDLSNKASVKFASHASEIWGIAAETYGSENADKLTTYIVENIGRRAILVLNSEAEFKSFGGSATNPTALFTLVIGGNIVSRGVTFNNLLSMFFTRDVKTKLQQDTYIQRARMFGSRGGYLDHFELSIPATLYNDWHRCFIYHRLALASIDSNLGSPVWIGDGRIAAVSGSSIDQSTVDIDNGEMSFQLFEFNSRLDHIAKEATSNLEKLSGLSDVLSESSFPKYLREFISQSLIGNPGGLKVFESGNVFPSMTQEEKSTITRRQGFLTIRESDRVCGAEHFIRIFKNQDGNARLFYKFDRSATFMKNLK